MGPLLATRCLKETKPLITQDLDRRCPVSDKGKVERRLDPEAKVDLGILWGVLAGQYYDSFVGVRGKARKGKIGLICIVRRSRTLLHGWPVTLMVYRM